MFQKAIFICILVLMGTFALTGTALAQSDQTSCAQPSDFFWYEAIGGSVGALTGGFASGVLGATLFCPKTSCTGFQDLGNACC